MGKLRIRGGGTLNGTIDVMGSKNAATPMVAAALLTPEPVELSNVPRIADFFEMIALLESVGANVRWTGEHTILVSATSIDPSKLNSTAVRRLRSSVLLLGALLGRTGSVRLPQPGGCHIGARPITTHLRAFKTLGADIEEGEDYVNVTMPRSALINEERTVILREMSVTGSENLLLFASTLPGKTVIHGVATEPHVIALANMLKTMGASIEGIGTHTLTVQGKALHGATVSIDPDPIEAGTLLILGAIAKGEIVVRGIHPVDSARILAYLEDCGVRMHIEEKDAEGMLSLRVTRSTLKANSFETRTWPGIPTDLQAPLSILATQAEGTTTIHETLYENRFSHLRELHRMGANILVQDAHHAIIKGPTPLYAQEIRSFDLRAGATLILAALIADGESLLHEVEQVDRGYERFDERLKSLGAPIERIT